MKIMKLFGVLSQLPVSTLFYFFRCILAKSILLVCFSVIHLKPPVGRY